MTIAQITQDVRSALRNLPTIEDRVFPIVAAQGTSYPFITYERRAVDYQPTKDGLVLDAATFDVHIVTATYMEGLSMLDSVVNLLTHMVSDFNASYAVKFEGFSEEYVDDANAYVQNVTFTL